MTDRAAVIRERILSLAAVTPLAQGRVYTQQFPQSTTQTAVLVERVGGGTADAHLRGGERLQQGRVQVTSMATTRAAAVALDNAIYGDGAGSGLAFWSGSVGSPSSEVRLCRPAGADPQEFYDAGELRMYRIVRDFMVWSR